MSIKFPSTIPKFYSFINTTRDKNFAIRTKTDFCDTISMSLKKSFRTTIFVPKSNQTIFAGCCDCFTIWAEGNIIKFCYMFFLFFIDVTFPSIFQNLIYSSHPDEIKVLLSLPKLTAETSLECSSGMPFISFFLLSPKVL